MNPQCSIHVDFQLILNEYPWHLLLTHKRERVFSFRIWPSFKLSQFVYLVFISHSTNLRYENSNAVHCWWRQCCEVATGRKSSMELFSAQARLIAVREMSWINLLAYTQNRYHKCDKRRLFKIFRGKKVCGSGERKLWVLPPKAKLYLSTHFTLYMVSEIFSFILQLSRWGAGKWRWMSLHTMNSCCCSLYHAICRWIMWNFFGAFDVEHIAMI